jgi:tyrosyl-tRNA synthetase
MSFPPVKEQLDLIKRNTVEIIPEEELERKLAASLKENKPLRIKLGCDPS